MKVNTALSQGRPCFLLFYLIFFPSIKKKFQCQFLGSLLPGFQIFFDPPPRVMKIKTKINKLDLTKLKSVCTAKKIVRQKDNPQNERKYLQMKQLRRH